MPRRLLLTLALWAVVVHPCQASDRPVPGYDIKKYEFARSYITALGYMKDIDDRWKKNAPRQFGGQTQKMILSAINDLSLDSSDLLIIKNYMLKYLISGDRLMKKVADIVVVAISQEISINHEEKTLWQKWYDLNAAGQATRPKQDAFVKNQYALELRRKEADKRIIQASVLMTKVIMVDPGGKSHQLAVTAQERQKLLDKLDSFGHDTLDWGLKPGQRTLEASIAVIREILEDSIWTCIDEK